MSGGFSDDGEPIDVWKETTIRARVNHTCSACKETIPPGHDYVRHVMIYDGGVDTVKRCARCQAIYKHLVYEAEDVEQNPDPALGCGHTYEEIHDRPPPDEIAALAFALPGEVTLPRKVAR